MRHPIMFLWLALVLVLAACGTDETADAGETDGDAEEISDEVEEEPADPDEVSDPEGEDEGEGADAATADAGQAGDGLEAVATVYPMAWVIETVAPAADLTQAGSQGQDPHDLELSPSERGLLESADVVVYMGPISFQPQVEQAVEANTAQVVSASDVVGEQRLLDWDGHHHHNDDHDHDHNGDDDHDHDHDHDHNGDDDHDHGEIDPHMWFDPQLMIDVVHATADAFSAADPEGAEGYAANAEAAAAELEDLDERIDERLTGCRLDTAVVSHEAYAYLLAPRGLNQEGISGAGGHGEPSPQRLAELVDRIAEDDIPLVLAEPVEGREGAEALATEAGVDLGEIYSLDIVDDDLRERGYPRLIDEQAEVFAEAMDCG